MTELFYTHKDGYFRMLTIKFHSGNVPFRGLCKAMVRWSANILEIYSLR